MIEEKEYKPMLPKIYSFECEECHRTWTEILMYDEYMKLKADDFKDVNCPGRNDEHIPCSNTGEKHIYFGKIKYTIMKEDTEGLIEKAQKEHAIHMSNPAALSNEEVIQKVRSMNKHRI